MIIHKAIILWDLYVAKVSDKNYQQQDIIGCENGNKHFIKFLTIFEYVMKFWNSRVINNTYS